MVTISRSRPSVSRVEPIFPEPASRWCIASRCARGLCPNCAGDSLIASSKSQTRRPVCRACGLRWAGDETDALGALVFVALTSLGGFAMPFIVLGRLADVRWGALLLLAALGAGSLAFVLRRSARSGWLLIYYVLHAERLPANWRQRLDLDFPLVD